MRKKGFTLIELLVVIAIIGMLAAALILTFSKVGDIARAMTCKANLRSLGQAVQTQGYSQEAEPNEWSGRGLEGDDIVIGYSEIKGWVNWTGEPQDPWAVDPRTSHREDMTMPGITGDLAYRSITNGTLWTSTGKDPSTYLCSAYKKAAAADPDLKDVDIWRSYVMNHRWGWGKGIYGIESFTVSGNSSDNSAEMVLMFAELPANNIDTSEEAADGKLDPEKEYIGFNHRIGKRNVAHVVYADGHVGVLMEPEGASEADMLTLTKDLCDGNAIDKNVLQKMR